MAYLNKTTFFTSDLHFFHKNLLVKKFTKRHELYGEDVNFMNLDLIKRWNSVVSPDCDVFNLGDIGFASKSKLLEVVSQLNGRIHLIKGNHDESFMHEFSNIVSVEDYAEISVEGQKIVMSHYPFYKWNGCARGTWCLHGHEHGNIDRDEHSTTWKIKDVGIDSHPDYRPFSFGELVKIMDKRSINAHH